MVTHAYPKHFSEDLEEALAWLYDKQWENCGRCGGERAAADF